MSEMFFVSYASEDEPRVRQVWRRLQQDFPGVEFWLDKENIPVGSEWDPEIKKAIRGCNAMILMLSSTSVEKEGYIQKEFRWAVDRAEEMPEGHSFLFWAKLDPCTTPARLSRWQGCNLYDGEADYSSLKNGIALRLEQLRKKKAGAPEPLRERRIALIVTEKFPLSTLQGVYRESTSSDLPGHGEFSPVPGREHGTARVIRANRDDRHFASLNREIHLFHPTGILVLGVGLTQTLHPGNTGMLVVPSVITHYRVREGTVSGVRDFELDLDPSPFTPNLRLASIEPVPADRKVGVLSPDLDLARLRRQLADTDLDFIELGDGRLFSTISAYTTDWVLISAIAGHLGSASPRLESAAYSVAKTIMHLYGLDK